MASNQKVQPDGVVMEWCSPRHNSTLHHRLRKCSLRYISALHDLFLLFLNYYS